MKFSGRFKWNDSGRMCRCDSSVEAIVDDFNSEEGAEQQLPAMEQFKQASARRNALQPTPEDGKTLAEHMREQGIQLAPHAGFLDKARCAMDRFKQASAARWR